MVAWRLFRRTALALVALGAAAILEPEAGYATPQVLFGHPVRVDRERKLIAWSVADSPYAQVVRLAWTALETKFPVEDNGLETWLSFSRFDPNTFDGVAWPHNPASFYAMLTDSAVLWYPFSGDRAAIDVARKALAYQIAHGSTPREWSWARVPFASSGAGDTDYGGADDSWCDQCGRGDGIGVIEPDKVGELGYAYLQMYEVTGEAPFRDAAVACADALAGHVRAGDETTSPWPFRVYGESNAVREEYSANVIGALKLFDELARLELGDVAAYRRARGLALDWLLRVPFADDAWSGYFEDVDIHHDVLANPNQYVPMHTARWLMAHPEADPAWRAHVAHLLAWTAARFGGDTPTDRGTQWGATVMSEQGDDISKMGSHTARFGATLALWYEATGDRSSRESAFRSLNWATYACGADGVVAVSEDPREGFWFSDGYGDYIRHFLVAMGAEPEWAPRREDHLLRSTSVVRHVEYGRRRVGWSTYDGAAQETLRLTYRPRKVVADGRLLAEQSDASGPGYTARALADGGYLVRVTHAQARDLVVDGN